MSLESRGRRKPIEASTARIQNPSEEIIDPKQLGTELRTVEQCLRATMGAKLAGDHGEHLAYPSLDPNRSSEIKFVNVSDGKLSAHLAFEHDPTAHPSTTITWIDHATQTTGKIITTDFSGYTRVTARIIGPEIYQKIEGVTGVTWDDYTKEWKEKGGVDTSIVPLANGRLMTNQEIATLTTQVEKATANSEDTANAREKLIHRIQSSGL